MVKSAMKTPRKMRTPPRDERLAVVGLRYGRTDKINLELDIWQQKSKLLKKKHTTIIKGDEIRLTLERLCVTLCECSNERIIMRMLINYFFRKHLSLWTDLVFPNRRQRNNYWVLNEDIIHLRSISLRRIP